MGQYKFVCKCGEYATNDTKAWRGHLMNGARNDPKGTHGRKIEDLIPDPPPIADDPRVEALERMIAEASATLQQIRAKPSAIKEESKPLASSSFADVPGLSASDIAVLEPQEPPKMEGLTVATPEAAPEPKAKKPQKESKPTSRRGILVLAGIMVIIAGICAVGFGNSIKASPVIAIGLVIMCAGGFITYKGFKTEKEDTAPSDAKSVITITKDGKKVAVKPNCINVYEDRVWFEYMDEPTGYLRKRRKGGKEFYFHMWNRATEALGPLKLPDTVFIGSWLVAVPLYMPANRRLARRRKDSLLKQLTPWAIVAAMCVVGFLMMVLVPGGNGGG